MHTFVVTLRLFRTVLQLDSVKNLCTSQQSHVWGFMRRDRSNTKSQPSGAESLRHIQLDRCTTHAPVTSTGQKEIGKKKRACVVPALTFDNSESGTDSDVVERNRLVKHRLSVLGSNVVTDYNYSKQR